MAVARADLLGLLLLAVASSCLGAAQDTCTLGGSTRYCGMAPDGSISGGFSSPCDCVPTLCCSGSGYCGPEPTFSNDSTSAFCSPSMGCQAAFGTCSDNGPGPVYFEYIGTGDTCSYYSCPGTTHQACSDSADTVYLASTINSIPVPASAPLYLIAFVLTDQGQALGNFQPIGSFEDAEGMWDPTEISALRSKTGKLMASLGGSEQQWSPLTDVTGYVQTATLSLENYYDNFNLSGFDIDYENNLSSANGTEETWLQAWCTIITNLKQHAPDMIITFAPYSATMQPYKDLQDCLASQSPIAVNINFILFQADDTSFVGVAEQTAALQTAQTLYAPTQIVATVSNCMLVTNPSLVSQLIQPLLTDGTIIGASVFDADQSLVAQPPFILETKLWGSTSAQSV